MPERSSLARHGLVMFVAVGVLNASSYAFHIAMSRLMTPERYGAVGALIAAFGILAVPANAMQAAVAKRVASAAAAGPVLRRALRSIGIVAAVLATIVAASSSPLRAFLHFDSVGPPLMIAAFVLVGLIGPVVRGGLQGLSRFGTLAVVMGSMGLLRVATGIPFVALGWGVTGAAAAYVLAEALGLAIGLSPLARLDGGSRAEPGIMRDAVAAVLALGSFWAMASLDGVLARHFFPTAASGHYAAAYAVGRAVLFLPMAIHMVAYPRFARADGRGRDARDTLRIALVVTGALGASAAFAVGATGRWVLPLVFGSGYEAAASPATWLAAAMALNAMTNVLVYFHLASGSRAAFLAGPGIAVEIVGIVAFHASVTQVAMVASVVAAVVFAAMLVPALRTSKRPTTPFADRMVEGHDMASDHFT